MSQKSCRVCGGAFYDDHLVYENMPRAAQHFPTAEDVAQERGETLIIRQCSGCGVVQSTTDPVDYYRDVIRATAFSPEMADFRLKQYAELDKKYAFNTKRIIEIGSGAGEYLELMQQAGWKVWGLEHKEESVSAARSAGLQIQKGYLDNPYFELENGPMEAFVCFNFMEHIPDLRPFLQAISNNLVTGGLGLVEVPNFDLMLQRSMSTEFIADHIYYFSAETLKRTLEINGFEILECNVIWHDYIISAVVRKRAELSLTEFVDHENRLREELTAYLSAEDRGRVAIWGAGHQALATIILARISDSLEYIIDSAPFKQNKFTPASHLPIYGPNILDDDPVDTILIMAAAYSDEIASQIRTKYKNRFNLAILRESGLEILK